MTQKAHEVDVVCPPDVAVPQLLALVVRRPPISADASIDTMFIDLLTGSNIISNSTSASSFLATFFNAYVRLHVSNIMKQLIS